MDRLLSPEHLDAFQEVDLRLAWIHHGYSAPLSISLENGPSVIGVNDRDYATIDATLQDMMVGDVMARERIFGEGGQDPNAVPSHAGVVTAINSPLFGSPFVAENPFQAMPGAFDVHIHNIVANRDDPLAVYSQPVLVSAMAEGLEIGRQLQIIDPFEYADGQAAVRGLMRAVADSPYETYRRGEARDVTIRNADMVRDLGNIAVAIAQSGVRPDGRKPILAFAGGSGHKGAQKLLSQQGVTFKSRTARRAPGDLFLHDAPIPHRERRIIKYHTNKWYSNLRGHGHEPMNTSFMSKNGW